MNLRKRRAIRWLVAGLALVLGLGLSVVTLTARSAERHPGECVVLLHGLGRTRWSMKVIEWHLRRHGYQVVNLSYPSRRLSIRQLGSEWLPAQLSAHNLAGMKRVHFVTHSMGGIVARQYLAAMPALRVGRVVMLTPPNQGSEVADRLRGKAWFRRLMGPAAVELGTGEGSVPRSLGPATFETGVIAADRSLNPLFSSWLSGQDDGRVTVESTRLAKAAEHLVVHATHTGVLWNPTVMKAVISFLRGGSFARQAED